MPDEEEDEAPEAFFEAISTPLRLPLLLAAKILSAKFSQAAISAKDSALTSVLKFKLCSLLPFPPLEFELFLDELVDPLS